MESNSLYFLYKLFLKCDRLSIDTRENCYDAFFVAIRGEKFNGNKFAKQAIELGAKYVVVDDKEYADPQNNIFYVENTVVFLQQLAKHHRNKFNIPVIGITGTNGKTTTKELIYVALSKKYEVLATEGNLNNHIGVPLTVLQLTDKHQIAVIEMGASRPGDIKELCEIADPTHGLITNIGEAHIEGFKTKEAIIETKRELYNYIAQTYGTIFINDSDPILQSILPKNIKKLSYQDVQIIKYIEHSNGDLEAVIEVHDDKMEGIDLKYINDELSSRAPAAYCNGIFIENKYKFNPYLEFACFIFGDKADGDGKNGSVFIRTSVKLFGRYNLLNCLVAFAVAHFFDVSIDYISDAIRNYKPKNKRSQVTKTKTNTLFVDCYNANPSSMNSALESFNMMVKKNDELYGKNYVILGDMLELGEQSRKKHQEIVNIIEKFNLKGITIGKNFSLLQSPNIERQFESVEQAIEFIKQNPINNKYILLKGSRGIKLEKLIEYL